MLNRGIYSNARNHTTLTNYNDKTSFKYTYVFKYAHFNFEELNCFSYFIIEC